MTWSPLANGFLTGKYRGKGSVLKGTRSEDNWVYNPGYFAANAEETLDVVLKVADELNASPAQVATRWILEQPAMTSVIVGARNCEQFLDNIGASRIQFSSDQLNRLNSVSKLKDRYPKSMEWNMSERRAKAVEMPFLED